MTQTLGLNGACSTCGGPLFRGRDQLICPQPGCPGHGRAPNPANNDRRPDGRTRSMNPKPDDAVPGRGKADPLVNCPTRGCGSLVAADLGVCAICRRRAVAPNALPAPGCHCPHPIVDLLDVDDSGDARCVRCGRAAQRSLGRRWAA